MGLRRQCQAAVTAVQFLTRLPVPGGMNVPAPDVSLLRAAVAYFPLVGGLVGALTGAVVWAAVQVWPPAVAVALGLAFDALLTGAFHEDAVADCGDAFGGGWTADDILRILKDSRVGSFGVVAVVLALAARGGSLAALDPGAVVAASAASGAVGRWGILLLMAAVPPVPGREGLSKDVGQRVGWGEVLLGGLTAAPGAVAYGWAEPARLLGGVVATAVLVAGWGWYVRRRVGGVTGDALGAGCYLGQLAVLLAAAAR